MEGTKEQNRTEAHSGNCSVPIDHPSDSQKGGDQSEPLAKSLARAPRSKWLRLAVLLAGILVGQFTIYGPSLLGAKILLPLDFLAAQSVYLPAPQGIELHTENIYLSDLIYASEPMRLFANSELSEGRLPMWAPYHYSGVPFGGPKFSPFFFPQYLISSPIVIPWMNLMAALVAGTGIYLFARRVLWISFWASAVVAWCYPLTGFFVFWQGYYSVGSVHWLPWILFATDKTISRKPRWAGPLLALFTALTLISGALDVAGQVLLTSGLYAVMKMAFKARRSSCLNNVGTLARLATAYLLGISMATPYLLPILDYAKTGGRLEARAKGSEERPPVGLDALPQVVLPDVYGGQARSRTGFRFHGEANQLESTAAAYAGLVATLALAPLAWGDRRRRPQTLMLLTIAFLSLSWSLNALGFVHVLRLPILNMMSHNRWVFAAAFAFLCMAAIGLDQLRRARARWTVWTWIPIALTGTVFLWTMYRVQIPPRAIQVVLPRAVEAGLTVGWITTMDQVKVVKALFLLQYIVATCFAGAGLALLLSLRFRPLWQRNLWVPFSILMLLDLIWFAHGRNPQSDPSLYYPPIPALTELAKSPDRNRMLGYRCLPPLLSSLSGLHDVRGYDAVDPARYVELLSVAAGPLSRKLSYATIQHFAPAIDWSSEVNAKLHPVLDLLGVSHVIFRGQPPPWLSPAFRSLDYWIWKNPNALPRAFVPSYVEFVKDKGERLQLLGDEAFKPRQLALVEQALELPEKCDGSVEIIQYTPTRIRLLARTQTAALVVLSDRWDAGWVAKVGDQSAPIHIVNHALRGVVVKRGESLIELYYEPKSFSFGLLFASFALAVIVLQILYISVIARRTDHRT